MLYVMVIVSLLQLALANWIVRRARHPGAGIVCTGLLFGAGPILALCLLPAVSIQALLLCVAVVAWRCAGRSRSFFAALSVGATLIAYAVAALLVFQAEREYASLRTLYAYENMEKRLPRPRAEPEPMPLAQDAEGRLTRLDDAFDTRTGGYRTYQLQVLHEEAVALFINSPGFGVARMLHPTRRGLGAGIDRNPVPLQPDSWTRTEWSPDTVTSLPSDDVDLLGRMHEQGILDFADARGYGYFKDRRRVAGFVPHRFSRVPELEGRWRLRTLALVGLVVHDEPVVYVSDRLPEMSALHAVPTRPPDRFEAIGLGALKRGEDRFVTPAGAALRMLGAVRSAQACVACHGGTRGDLLGAFSYTLGAIAHTGAD